MSLNKNIPGTEYKIIFEKEVNETYLKELKLTRKLKKLQEDFND